MSDIQERIEDLRERFGQFKKHLKVRQLNGVCIALDDASVIIDELLSQCEECGRVGAKFAIAAEEQQREIERLKAIRKCDRHGKGIIRHAACSCGLDKHEVADG